jgi:hypothetical protein
MSEHLPRNQFARGTSSPPSRGRDSQRVRPESWKPALEVLEDRSLPNNLFGLPDGFGDTLFPEGLPGLTAHGLVRQPTSPSQTNVAPTVTANGAVDTHGPTPSPGSAPSSNPGSRGPLDGGPNPGVLPPQSHPYGKTYGEWEAAWWKWAFSLPADHHPLTDTAPASTGQTGNVWFLGGTFITETGPGGEIIGRVTRDATIPTGKALFFPLVNTEGSTAEGNGATEAELRAYAKMSADTIVPSSLFVQIDGRSLQGLGSFRAQSPLFIYGPLPVNNLLGFAAGTTSPSVSDGYHVMLTPLSVGQHTLHFGGTAEAPGFTFIQDITYHITVAPS